jgi:hypothetical protein
MLVPMVNFWSNCLKKRAECCLDLLEKAWRFAECLVASVMSFSA